MAPNVDTLIEALPYIREFRGQTFVVRCVSDLSQAERAALCRDIAILRFVGVKAVVVHPQDDGTNHHLVHDIGAYGKATGLSGSDGAPRWLLSLAADGALSANEDLIRHVIEDYTPVIEAVAVGPGGDAQPADADLAAAKLAVRLRAYKLLLVVGHGRVTVGDDEVSEMRATPDVVARVQAGSATAGALEAAVVALDGGVRFAHVLPADVPHALLLELFTDRGYGTKIRSADEWATAPDLDPRGYTVWNGQPA